MRITPYLRQTATFEEHQGTDIYANNVYGTPETIKCRIDVKHKLKIVSRHEGYIAVTEIMTEHPVKIGDKINGEHMLAVEHIVDFKGAIIGYLAYPRPPIGFAN